MTTLSAGGSCVSFYALSDSGRGRRRARSLPLLKGTVEEQEQNLRVERSYYGLWGGLQNNLEKSRLVKLEHRPRLLLMLRPIVSAVGDVLADYQN